MELAPLDQALSAATLGCQAVATTARARLCQLAAASLGPLALSHPVAVVWGLQRVWDQRWLELLWGLPSFARSSGLALQRAGR
ncbi:MAG: hypothetical protein WDW38_005154 [Sanguina aurantia]